MFGSKTLFIVGAGASNEAGLPTGADLKTLVANNIDIRFEGYNEQISGNPEITGALNQHVRQVNADRPDIGPYIEAAWRIRDAMPQSISIDNYIDAHRDEPIIALVAKLGIGAAILGAERGSRLYFDEAERNTKLNFKHVEETWYMKFWQQLTENVAKNEVEDVFRNVSFITFNYDRCIEHFLLSSLQNYYGISFDKSCELVNDLTILHPFGLVGQLSWQTEIGGTQFGVKGGVPLLDIAGQLRTFTERVGDEEAINEIRGIVQTADTIVFLGFAFHKLNMDLLKPNGTSKTKRVFATASGISSSDCEVVKATILETLQPKKTPKIFLRNDLRCNTLFDEYWRTIS